MIAIDLVQTIRSQVADEVHVSATAPDRLEISAPFFFEDGDSYSFAFVHDESLGQWIITDDGDVLARSAYSGLDITAGGRRDRFLRIVEFYGIRESDRTLLLPVESDRFAETFYKFSQACLEISRLTQFSAGASRSTASRTLPLRVAGIIESASLPNIARTKNWHDPNLDPNQIYDVDYLIQGNRGRVLLFAITSTLDCWRKTASCLHYRQRQFEFAGLGVFDETRAVSEQSKTAFVDADAQALTAADADEIVEFIREKVA